MDSCFVLVVVVGLDAYSTYLDCFGYMAAHTEDVAVDVAADAFEAGCTYCPGLPGILPQSHDCKPSIEKW